MKRSRTGEILTGGTGDVSPQWLQLGSITTTGDAQVSEEQVTLPVNRFSARKGKSIVIELLAVEFGYPAFDQNPAAGGAVSTANSWLSTIALNGGNFASPRVVQWGRMVSRGAFTAGGSYFAVENAPERFDMTDGAGHGTLIATDSIFWGCYTGGFAGATTFFCRLLYRFKEVTLEEYIGIVQSQQ